MILADTSVWIDHLRRGNTRLTESLEAGEVLVHPFVIGELACGRLANRSEILRLLQRLPQTPVASQEELLRFIEDEEIYGVGLGWIDASLLASARLARCRLWTLDRALARAASWLDVRD